MMLLPALSAGTSTYLLWSSVKYALICGSSKILWQGRKLRCSKLLILLLMISFTVSDHASRADMWHPSKNYNQRTALFDVLTIFPLLVLGAVKRKPSSLWYRIIVIRGVVMVLRELVCLRNSKWRSTYSFIFLWHFTVFILRKIQSLSSMDSSLIHVQGKGSSLELSGFLPLTVRFLTHLPRWFAHFRIRSWSFGCVYGWFCCFILGKPCIRNCDDGTG